MIVIYRKIGSSRIGGSNPSVLSTILALHTVITRETLSWLITSPSFRNFCNCIHVIFECLSSMLLESLHNIGASL